MQTVCLIYTDNENKTFSEFLLFTFNDMTESPMKRNLHPLWHFYELQYTLKDQHPVSKTFYHFKKGFKSVCPTPSDANTMVFQSCLKTHLFYCDKTCTKNYINIISKYISMHSGYTNQVNAILLWQRDPTSITYAWFVNWTNV